MKVIDLEQICKEQNQLQDISKKFSIYSESVLVSAKCKINIYTYICTTYIRMVKISSLYIKQSQHDTVSRNCTCTVILYSVCLSMCMRCTSVCKCACVSVCAHMCMHAVPFKMLNVLQQARKELLSGKRICSNRLSVRGGFQ